jgi:hypothetical protein
MTPEEFARAIAVTASSVNRWESDHTTPSPLARRAIELLVRSRANRTAAADGAPAVAAHSVPPSPASAMRHVLTGQSEPE